MLSAEAVNDAVRAAANQYFRLVLIISQDNSTKPVLLKELQDILEVVSIKIGAEISQRLLEMTERQRALRLSYLLDEILAPYPLDQVIVLDNIEILFDRSLASNPLSLLQKISRNRTVIVVWSGSLQDGWLTYAVPGHPEYKRYPVQDVIIVQPSQ